MATDCRGPYRRELSNLANLQHLNLASNRLYGSIPTELGSLANLKGLFLGDNRLTGSIPPELGHLATLEELSPQPEPIDGVYPA